MGGAVNVARSEKLSLFGLAYKIVGPLSSVRNASTSVSNVISRRIVHPMTLGCLAIAFVLARSPIKDLTIAYSFPTTLSPLYVCSRHFDYT